MIEPENWWFNRPVPADNESTVLSYRANHTQGRRAVGGKLYVTSQRIFFAPNRIDAKLLGASVTLVRESVVEIGTVPPNYSLWEAFSGAWRTRLVLRTTDGSQYCFVVNDLDKVVDQINSVLFPKPQSKMV